MKKIFIIFCILLLINTTLASSAINQQRVTSAQKERSLKISQNCTIPTWPVGTEWTYQTSISFAMYDETTDLSLYLSLSPLKIEVIQAASIYIL